MITCDCAAGTSARNKERLERTAAYKSRYKGLAVGALGTGPKDAAFFAENEIIVEHGDFETARQLAKDYGGKLIEPKKLLDPPRELRRRREAPREPFPAPHVVRFENVPVRPPSPSVIKELVDREIHTTSDMAAAVAAIVARHGSGSRRLGLNILGETVTLPLQSASDAPSFGDPFDWDEYSGWAGVGPAWQLVESVRAMRSVGLVTIGILDGGFWRDPTGPDFSGFAGVNLIDESGAWNGPNPNRCTGDSLCNWHGIEVASAACASVDSHRGGAGSGGTVAMPVCFRSDLGTKQVIRCLQYCAAWGIDVVNMSFSITYPGIAEPFFPKGSWDDAFNFASTVGDVVIVVGAGNDNQNLPNDAITRPASRTPNVVTVGALDNFRFDPTHPTEKPTRSSYSNYGPAVHLWAPGTAHVGVNGDLPAGGMANGTSIASPIAAGVAAMMRAVAPGLAAAQIRARLIDSGWAGEGHVTRGLDARAAILSALDGALPDPHEPNDAAPAGRALFPTGASGALEAGLTGVSAISKAGDVDYWTFTVDDYSWATIKLEWYVHLGRAMMLEIDGDGAERALGELIWTRDTASGTLTAEGLLPPGAYRLRVQGSAPTAYALGVKTKTQALARDRFEPNDSFDTATILLFQRPAGIPGTWLVGEGPGDFEATIHLEAVPLLPPKVKFEPNRDYFYFEGVDAGAHRKATLSVYDSDLPLSATLFDAGKNALQQWHSVRGFDFHPKAGQSYYLKIEAEHPTRYRIAAWILADIVVPDVPKRVPELPDWGSDPDPTWLRDLVSGFVVDVNWHTGGDLHFERPEQGLKLELLDSKGMLVRSAVADGLRLVVPTEGLANGRYVLRAERQPDTNAVRLRSLNPFI